MTDAPMYTAPSWGADVRRPDGTILSAQPSLALRNHSPTGFSWGYGGSGPAQFALALLLDRGVDEDVALALYQDFKWQVVTGLQQGPLRLEVRVIDEYVNARERGE